MDFCLIERVRRLIGYRCLSKGFLDRIGMMPYYWGVNRNEIILFDDIWGIKLIRISLNCFNSVAKVVTVFWVIMQLQEGYLQR